MSERIETIDQPGGPNDRPVPTVFLFEGFMLDAERQTLRRAGTEVPLRPKSFDVLCYLLHYAGRVVSKQQLLDAIWPNVVVTEDSLTRCVSDIRAALGDVAQEIVKTVPRRGYLLACPVQSAARGVHANHDLTVRRQQQTESTEASLISPAVLPRRSSFARRVVWIAAPVLIGLGIFLAAAAFNALGHRDSEIASLQVAPNITRRTTPHLSIVVLPLRINDPTKAYLAEAITEDITTDLSRIPGSFVIARSSAHSYADKPRDARKVGAELGVRYVLDGSVQRTDNGMQLNVQLIDAEFAREIWAERFESPTHDLTHLQNQVTSKIARSLHLELMEAESARGRQKQSDHPEAYDLVLQAWSLYERKTPDSVDQARKLLTRALAVDSQSALGWSLLSETYTADVLSRWLHLRGGASRDDWIRKAQEAADNAIKIDPDNLYAVGSRATVLQLQGKPEQALAMFERQIALNRNFAPAWHRISYTYATLGEPDKALTAGAEAIRVSPRDGRLFSFYVVMAAAHLHAGRDADALVWAQKSVRQRPEFGTAHAWLAAAAALLGNTTLAATEMAEFTRLQPSYTVSSFRAEKLSENPVYLRQRERFYAGLRLAGLSE